jgi:hypothetical protein
MNQPSVWYVQIAKEKRGPVSANTLIQLYKTGVIKGNTPVWKKGLPAWIQLSQTGLLKGITSEQVKRTKLTVLIGLCAVVLIGAFGLHWWHDAHRLDGAWQGKSVINNSVTLYFEPNTKVNGTTMNILYARSAMERETYSFAYTMKSLSSNSVQVDYCEFFQRDGSIVLDSEHMKNYVITFSGDNSAAIDNCNGITSISKIDSARAKSLLNIS